MSSEESSRARVCQLSVAMFAGCLCAPFWLLASSPMSDPPNAFAIPMHELNRALVHQIPILLAMSVCAGCVQAVLARQVVPFTTPSVWMGRMWFSLGSGFLRRWGILGDPLPRDNGGR
jgi:hypothetical protein